MAKFTILGMGGFGLALAVMLNNFGHEVTVWSAFKQEIDDIIRDGENRQNTHKESPRGSKKSRSLHQARNGCRKHGQGSGGRHS